MLEVNPISKHNPCTGKNCSFNKTPDMVKKSENPKPIAPTNLPVEYTLIQ